MVDGGTCGSESCVDSMSECGFDDERNDVGGFGRVKGEVAEASGKIERGLLVVLAAPAAFIGRVNRCWSLLPLGICVGNWRAAGKGASEVSGGVGKFMPC